MDAIIVSYSGKRDGDTQYDYGAGDAKKLRFEMSDVPEHVEHKR